LVRAGARVVQQLQRQRLADVTRMQGGDGGQRATGAVAPHGDAAAVQAQRAGFAHQPGQRVPGVVHGGGKAVLRRQAIVHRDDGRAALRRQHATQHVVRGQVADGETAAVKVQQHGQRRGSALGLGGIQARANLRAVARGDLQLLHARQLRRRHIEQARCGIVGGACLRGGQAVERRALGTGHVLDQQARGGRQQLQGLFVGQCGVGHGRCGARKAGDEVG
jgi:hypothetical protein